LLNPTCLISTIDLPGSSSIDVAGKAAQIAATALSTMSSLSGANR